MKLMNYLMVAGAAGLVFGAVAPQKAAADDYYRTYSYTRTITTPDMPAVVEERVLTSPVVIERSVQQPIMVEKVIEKPVTVERVIEKPVTVEKVLPAERVIASPVIIHEHGTHHLLNFSLF